MSAQNIKKQTKRKAFSAEERKKRREQRAYEASVRSLFIKVGFSRVKTDHNEFNFLGRTGEIDDIFLYENVIVIAEYYTGSADTSHFLKKKALYDLILNNSTEFVRLCQAKFSDFPDQFGSYYSESDARIKIIYATQTEPSSELHAVCGPISILSGNNYRYFISLVKAIERSARSELLKFLGLSNSDIGRNVHVNSMDTLKYIGFLLPEKNSSYPPGFKIVTFYADPGRILDICYVLRRDGWRDDDRLYQRIIIPKKIRAMRGYLINNKRVFVNNIVATLPASTSINSSIATEKNISSEELEKAQTVSVHIPHKFDSIGIVDGQHRLYCYHEGTDKAEEEIKHLRRKQTLLITGIVYPKDFSDSDKMRFEAKLFLEINDNQTRVKSALTQDIELILRPSSTTSLAKRVIQGMSRSGPYRGLLQTSYFDAPEKIKTASIVSYGLKPLVKLDGSDSIFSVWPGRATAKTPTGQYDLTKIDEYVAFAIETINRYMLSAKLAYGTESWDLSAESPSKLLRPTTIVGLIVCLRMIIQSGRPLDEEYHRERLKVLKSVNLDSYRSSQWRRLGLEIFSRCYEGN